MSATNKEKHFLPYQARWLRDKHPIKIWEKSRRIGATYVQAYEDTPEAAAGLWDVWFSSADESAAKEYIFYVEKWAKLLNKVAKSLGEIVIDSDKDIKALAVQFASGKRINALTSNPKRFRSKGGKVVLDEFAFHEDQEAMWAAAEPATTWGFPLRILSTYNGKSNLYYRFVDDIKRKKLDPKIWNLHTTSLELAVKEGLLDRITGHITTEEERTAWIEDKHKRCRSEAIWLQEYCCIPVDETTAFLTYEMIARCERQKLLVPPEQITGDLYVGMDIARKRHLSVIWGLERLGFGLYTRFYKVMEKAPFRHQREALFEILNHRRLRRCCIDATGIGMQLAEEAREKFGQYRVEEITFTSAVKEELASTGLPYFEDMALFIPDDELIREDLHSVKKVTTAANHVRFDVSATEEENAHADRFWALMLAIHAAHSYPAGSVEDNTTSRKRRTSSDMMHGYYEDTEGS